MPTSQLMKKCVECNKMTMHFQEKPNYILHVILSIITAGVWLLVWLLFINAKDPQCSICGRNNINKSNEEMIFLETCYINRETILIKCLMKKIKENQKIFLVNYLTDRKKI
jgi:hypothetical protein